MNLATEFRAAPSLIRWYVIILVGLAALITGVPVLAGSPLGNAWFVLALGVVAAAAERGSVRLTQTTEESISILPMLFVTSTTLTASFEIVKGRFLLMISDGRSLIEKGQEEGARLVFGGARSEGDLAAGNFVAPTLFTDVNNDMTIATEEVFGPVLSVIPFTDEDEAIRIANATEYGLAATVWTNDLKRAIRLSKALRAGTVGINGYQLEPHAAFGGFQQSGLGREGGQPAIEAYTELKTVMFPLTDEMM